jgi:alkylated DNA repair protein (DNA oxidative demethylase)
MFPEFHPGGFYLLQGWLNESRQEEIVREIETVAQEAPFFTPTMPRFGAPFRIEITNCGDLGWVSDKQGYRYQPTHPLTGNAWPRIPERILEEQRLLCDCLGFRYFNPESCLINRYREGGSLGLHRDDTEKKLDAPIISFSIGERCVFSLGGLKRTDPLERYIIQSGDAVVLSGESRLRFHKVENVEGLRYNLTIRQVN